LRAQILGQNDVFPAFHPIAAGNSCCVLDEKQKIFTKRIAQMRQINFQVMAWQASAGGPMKLNSDFPDILLVLTLVLLMLAVLMCRAYFINWKRRAAIKDADVVTIFDIPVSNLSMKEAVDWALATATGKSCQRLAFVNADSMNKAYTNPAYHQTLLSSDRVFGDGAGIRMAAEMAGHKMRANVNGTDIFPQLCEQAAARQIPIFLLGGAPETAARAAANMKARFPALPVAGTHHGYFEAAETDTVIEKINISGARILLVGFGAPRQDMWIEEWQDKLAPGLAMGVGGLFDFYSNRIPRAPLWMREYGVEWIYRLYQEPRRMWRRYIIGNPLFLLRLKYGRFKG